MSLTSLSPLVSTYRTVLSPIPPFTWFGAQISTLDLAATVRLCLVLRQVREALRVDYTTRRAPKAPVEPRSLARDISTTLLIVYAGEALVGPWLGFTPSFMTSGTVPLLYAFTQALIEALPAVPPLSVLSDLPLAVLDGFTRAFLLCSLVPPAVLTNAKPEIATSPWALLLSSLIIPNAGFFLTNLLSLLHPTSLTLTTPAELQPYGWTTTDLWAAPLVTGLYALLTHAQPFWADAHRAVAGLFAPGNVTDFKQAHVEAVDPEAARALCAAILAGLFVVRTAKTYNLLGLGASATKEAKSEKQKIQ